MLKFAQHTDRSEREIMARYIKFIVVVIILIASSLNLASASQTKKYRWVGELQSGAQKGLAHVALGYRFNDKHQISAGFGTVPTLSDHEELTISSINYMYHGKTEYEFNVEDFIIKLRPINYGFAYIQADHDDLFTSLPEQYPDGYYFPTANRVVFEYQIELGLTEQIDVFVKFSMLDVGFANYVRNFSFYRRNYAAYGLGGVTSWGIGIARRF